MAVTEQDVRHVAALARLGVGPERIPTLVNELNGILEHMEVLARVDVERVEPAVGIGSAGMPLRPDEGPPVPLEHPLPSFAPEMRDGFFLVPRLATHGDVSAAEALDDLEE